MSKVSESDLATRMKRYEEPYRYVITPKSYMVLRVDGRAFHTYTRSLMKPYDLGIANALDSAARVLCKEAAGCRFAYGQSDEYSFLLTDMERHESQQWFGGVLQKIVSIGASVFTQAFNDAWGAAYGAHFDCRAFILPSAEEVENYFIWRQQDAARNSLNMLADCHCSAKSLLGKSAADRHEILHAKGINWANEPTWFKHGRCIVKMKREKTITWKHKKTGEGHTETVEETYWGVDNEIPVFTKDRQYLRRLILPTRESSEAAA